MFSLKHHSDATRSDLSAELREDQDWQVGEFLVLEHHLDVTAIALDPVSSLLAIGTARSGLHVFGGPGVEKHWALPEAGRIKFLQFAVSISKLLSIDDTNHLHVWDLSSRGQPKLQASPRFNASVTWLAVSPSHAHAFIALGSGEVKTYDLLCLRLSPYTIPNLLTLYEKETLRETEHLISIAEPSIPIEVVIHPRNLNLLFVAYSGGVVLSDLEQRSTVSAYRLILPPGAPGGSGHGGPGSLKLRRPSVTAIAVHPTGHFFATGHSDGCISFWAVEDPDSPLTARTLDAVDVHLPDMDRFDDERTDTTASEREPIFKLAWSGFPNSSDARGGATALFILGGQAAQDAPGMYVLWLLAFNPAEPPASPGLRTLHPLFRKAMQDTLVPLDATFYPTSGLTQDFYLVPRDNPHFSGSWDPAAILLISEGEGKSCGVEAYSVSLPPIVSPVPTSPKPRSPLPSSANTQSDLADELASTLESMKVDDASPRRLSLPPALWSGPAAITQTDIHILERDPYERLIDNADVDEDRLPIQGGSAWIDEESAGNDLKFAKYQPHRILVSSHRDCTVKFRDLSAQIRLRTESAPLQRDIPNPLQRLTIDLLFVLADPSLSTIFPPGSLNQVKISNLAFAAESLECYIILRSGEIIVYRFNSGSGDISRPKELEDKELVSLQHVAAPLRQRFHPYILLAAKKGPVVACAPSDIGFFAASFSGGLLMIVDMRGPKIIYRSDKDTSGKRRSALFQPHSQDLETYTSLAWTVCCMASDPVPRVRLLAIPASGRTKVLSLNRSPNGSWTVQALQNVPEATSQPVFSAVIDVYTGARFKADRYGLSLALDPSSGDALAGKGHGYWIVAGAKGVRCTVDVDGDKVGKNDWPHKAGKVESCEIVERNGSQAFVAFTDRHEALIYSLPSLEHLHTLQLVPHSNLPISPDPSGDFLHHTPFPSAAALIARTSYSTLFDIRRPYYRVQPEVDLLASKGSIPPQPQPVPMGPQSIKDVLGGWFGAIGAGAAKGVLTGDQIDALLAGPNRPIPKPVSPPPATTLKSVLPSDRASIRTSTTASSRQTRTSSRSPSPGISQEESGTGGLYDRLTSAMSERGQVLGDLEEQFKSLEEGSRSMVAQAKRLAGEQTAKSWFGL